MRVLVLLMLAVSLAAKKGRDWQTGKLVASRTVDTGSHPTYPVTGGGSAAAAMSRIISTTTTSEMMILGGGFAYTVRSLGRNGGFAFRPCRYIVGDEVKYAQSQNLLYTLDADGKECRAEIMIQERLPDDLKPAQPKP